MTGWAGMLAVGVAVLAGLCAVEACNEAVCASLVSKCMLIKCCECDMSDMKNCSCCKDCQVCLSKLYTECCSCVGLCPMPDPDEGLTKTSSIEDLSDPIPELFSVLTVEPDVLGRWTTFTYPALPSLPSSAFRPDTTVSTDGHSHPDPLDFGIAQNCTTAFFPQCMSIRKCKVTCRSMGAARYRWFHDHGCCQCVGHTCLDYGLNEPHCLQCPSNTALDLTTTLPEQDVLKEGMAVDESVKTGL